MSGELPGTPSLFPDLTDAPRPPQPPRRVPCPHCKGEGRFEEEDPEEREYLQLTGNGWWIECGECEGEGTVSRKRAEEIEAALGRLETRGEP